MCSVVESEKGSILSEKKTWHGVYRLKEEHKKNEVLSRSKMRILKSWCIFFY